MLIVWHQMIYKKKKKEKWKAKYEKQVLYQSIRIHFRFIFNRIIKSKQYEKPKQNEKKFNIINSFI